MGNWNINIQGIGCHHNGKPDIDADLLAAEFVALLRSKGQLVEAATFTPGGKVDLYVASFPPNEMEPVHLNGVRVQLPAICSYEKICEAAGSPGRNLSVTYRHARHGKQGILHRGQTVELVPGTAIDATFTGNA